MSIIGLQRAIIIISGTFIASCQMTPIEHEKQQIRKALNVPISVSNEIKTFSVPDSVSQAIKPKKMVLNQKLAPAQPRFDIAANSVNVRQFFSNLVAQTPFSVVFHPDLTGKISLQLKQVTLQETIDSVSDLYGFIIKRTGRIIQVLPASLVTQTINFNYLMIKRNGISQTSITSGGLTERANNNSSQNNSSNSSGSNNSSNNSGSSRGNSNSGANGTFIESRTETDYWQELEQTLTSLISGEGRQVLISPHAGMVTVRAYPNEIKIVKDYLARAERNIQRQVILEARIIEVTLSDSYQQGIEWQNILTHTGTNNITNFGFSTSSGKVSDVISSTLGGVASLTFSNINFSGVVNLLKTQGDVNVLSSPRITALNNQKAVIKVGNDEYFVTDISSSSSNVGTSVVSNPNIELTPFFSGIALDVTPQIDERGRILLHVHPSVIDVVEQQKVIELQSGTFQLPLANSSIRETDTIIRAESGDIVVLGGLMSSRTIDNESKVPLLGSIPLLGELFTSRSEMVKKTELIILIRPVIVEPGTWEKQLDQSRQLIQGWYPNEER
ncbi:MAG: pilus (MSHA type) biogenesis protein MshL [Gammaproteobacteria bacterium]|nr:pilus (MSHA type) biogenesis protein MshL [Gammaproteobacteria bacterium]